MEKFKTEKVIDENEIENDDILEMEYEDDEEEEEEEEDGQTDSNLQKMFSGPMIEI